VNGDVRNEAAVLMGALIPLQPRVDPLVTELIGVANTAGEDGVKTAILRALCEILSKAGKLVGGPQKVALLDLIRHTLEDGRGTPVTLPILSFRTNCGYCGAIDVLGLETAARRRCDDLYSNSNTRSGAIEEFNSRAKRTAF
jgi:hypothetical protein